MRQEVIERINNKTGCNPLIVLICALGGGGLNRTEVGYAEHKHEPAIHYCAKLT